MRKGDRMNKKIVLISVICISLIMNSFASIFYIDTLNHWAEEDIHYVSNNLKLFYGYKDGTFRPNDYISRSEFIALMNRTLMETGVFPKERYVFENYEISFAESESQQLEQSSVKESQELYRDLFRIYWAYQDIVTLNRYMKKNNCQLKDVFPGNVLIPSKPITRGETAKLMSYFIAPSVENHKDLEFKDFDPNRLSNMDIDKVLESKIMEGFEDNTLRMNQKLTRAEAAVILKRLYRELENYQNSVFLHLEGRETTSQATFSLFGNYAKRNEEEDKRYKKAIISLEYLSVVKKIPYNEASLYDTEPYETLSTLLESDYFNKVGLYYYLLGSSNPIMEKTKLREQLKNSFLDTTLGFSDSQKVMEKITILSLSKEEETLIFEKWKKSIQNESQRMQYLVFKTSYLLRHQRYEEAIDLYPSNTKWQDHQNLVNFHLNKAYIYYVQGKYLESEEYLRQAKKNLNGFSMSFLKEANLKFDYGIRKNLMKREIQDR